MNSRNHHSPEIINRPAVNPFTGGDHPPIRWQIAPGRIESGFRAGLAVFTVLFLAWFMFAADSAEAAAYKGETMGGSSITFALKGSRVTGIRTVVPTLCLETTGNYSSRAGGELFQPVAAARIGRTVKSKALQPAAMNVGARATKNYEVTVKKRGKAVTGKLNLNFSFLIPNLYGAQIFICSGTTTFAASPR